MARHSFPSRIVLAFLLAAVLTAPAIAAQPHPRVEIRQDGFLTALVSELRIQLWGLLIGFREKNGCGADPRGGSACSNGSSVVGTDQGKNGCVIDPHGGPVCGNGSTVTVTDQADEGCGIDPHGGCGH